MDRVRIRQTWIQWLPWELHPQRPRKDGEGVREREREERMRREVECEVKNKRGEGEQRRQQWGG